MKTILYYFQDAMVTFLVCVPFYILLRFLYVKIKKTKIHWKREVVFGILVLYLLWLASETLIPKYGFKYFHADLPYIYNHALERIRNDIGINLIPFVTIDRFTSFRNFGQSMVNLVGNVIIFIPLGYFLPLLWQGMRRFWKVSLIGFFTSCFIECLQLFIDRSVDIDDVILNTIGVVIGYLIMLICFKVFPNQKKKYLVGGNEKI